MNNSQLYIAFAFTFLIFSCEKVIDIDLNSAPNKVVIEGIINNQPGPYYVRLSKSIGFSQPNNSTPMISGASVIIIDNAGVLDTLMESSPGVYATTKIIGVSGRTYELNVTINGQKFVAVSKMPNQVLMDSLSLTYIPFGGGSDQAFATPNFRDAVEQGNNYRFVTKINQKQDKNNIVDNDNIGNGTGYNRPVFSDKELKKGDSVEVEMQCIDRNVYNYFFTLANTDQGVTPSNPPTNIQGDCLGYFSAHTSQKKSIIVP